MIREPFGQVRRLRSRDFAPRDLLSTGEMARELAVTDETIRRWIEDGRIPAIRLPSGQWRIRRSALEAILAGEQPADRVTS